MQCALCKRDGCTDCLRDTYRTYYYCLCCGLIFVSDDRHITTCRERERYDLHDNTIHNAGYVKYIGQLADVIIARVKNDAMILDFGCGEHAVLGLILSQKGYTCDAYDPLYGLYARSEPAEYDMIVMCEVIEHLRNLSAELDFIQSRLKINGKIVIRTQLYPSLQSLKSWWYIQDPTHINFFSRKTIDYLGNMLGCAVIESVKDDIFVVSRGASQK